MKTGRYHILIDVSGADSQILNDEAALEQFLKELPGVINMNILKGPVVTTGIPENPGLSGFVIIDFSHISIHTFTKHAEALVDIFSCKPYQKEDAVNAVLNHFKVAKESSRIQEVCWG